MEETLDHPWAMDILRAMETLREYRIDFRVGRLPFTWVRSGPSRIRVAELALRAIKDQYGPAAELRAIERITGVDTLP